jgi:hypothetical protein
MYDGLAKFLALTGDLSHFLSVLLYPCSNILLNDSYSLATVQIPLAVISFYALLRFVLSVRVELETK